MNISALLHIPSLIAPERAAIVNHRTTHCSDVAWSYNDLWERCLQVAGALSAHGLKPGDRVAVIATNSAEVVAIIFGAAAAGMVAVPLNFKAAAADFEFLIDDCACRLMIADSRYESMLDGLVTKDRALMLLDDGPRSWGAFVDQSEPATEAADVDGSSEAVLLYTSGTTSRPKGVRITHSAVSGYVMGIQDALGADEDEAMLLAVPLYHVAGLTATANALYGGRRVVAIPQFEIDDWLNAVEHHAVTHAFVVPTMLYRITQAASDHEGALGSLRAITYGAAPMPISVITNAIKVLPPGIEYSGAYGQTETTSTVAVLGPDDHVLDGDPNIVARNQRRLSSVGRVLDDVEVRIVNEDGAIVGPEELGEVWLRTARAAAGYWNAASSRANADADGWIHTGDLGFVDADGYLYLRGRHGDLIIRGGENVAPEDIEQTLLGLQGVHDVGVVGVPDEELGEAIVAAIVAEDEISVAQLEEFARGHLAPFKRPSRYVMLEELPRTSTGKLVRRRLTAELLLVESDDALPA